ncbi:DUF692 domain-containing protein [Pseudomonas asplenii]|uniref:MNIO family bufferin maturase n=1 Tax=Pseudomonas asplenii TaxID=53407 RepID=UPI002362FB4D|nr:DUF692 domain-containing protein [Pseudomonas asplenii]
MNSTASLGAGLGLKPQHFTEALEATAPGLWFEVHAENYLLGGPRRAWLERLGQRHPLALHGVSLSLAADAPPDPQHLARLRHLADAVAPVLVSEHLAWATWRGHYYPDLLPCPRSRTALARIADNVARTQDALGRRIAVENPSHYLHLEGHDLDEPAFLGELAHLSGCGLLLDLNNVYVSTHNLGQHADDYLRDFPLDLVMEVHLAGHRADHASALLIDSHDTEISEPVWALYRNLLARTGPLPTLIERDDALPDFDTLMSERTQAQTLLENTP